MLRLIATLLFAVFALSQPTLLLNPATKRDCSWRKKKIQSQQSLISHFFNVREGLCFYTYSETEQLLYLTVYMFDPEDENEKQLIIDLQVSRSQLSKDGRAPLKYGKQINVQFVDEKSQVLFDHQLRFKKDFDSKKVGIDFYQKKDKLAICFSGHISLELKFIIESSHQEEQLIVLWIFFIFLNYQWFYFDKNDGLILRQFRSLKKGWCFKIIYMFWVRHTTLPFHFKQQIQKYYELLYDGLNHIQIWILFGLSIFVVIFVFHQLWRLIKKLNYFTKKQLHIRDVVDYILIFIVMVLPLQTVLVLMIFMKLIQVGYVLTLQESHFIKYYQDFGKLTLDWIQGAYFTLYSQNFAQNQTNYIVAASIFSIFVLEVMLFLMQILSHNEYFQLSQQIIGLHDKLTSIFKNQTPLRVQIDSCTICLESFSSNSFLQVVDFEDLDSFDATTIAITKCNHKFHGICLQKWFRQNSECPLDRQSLKKYVMEQL